MKIAFIGIGRLGGALTLALSKKGCEINQLIVRQNKSAEKIIDLIKPKPEILSHSELNKISSDVIFITTPDVEIRITAERLAENLKSKPIVFHTSGALSSEVLESLKKIGCKTASLHPLVSVSDSKLGAKRFKNAFFCIEGEPEACKTAGEIVTRLEGRSFTVPTEYKALYHAAAVMASGHLTALFSIAAETLSICGLDEEKSLEILFPLVKSTVENLSLQTPAQALTGTFARADVETLKSHLETLRKNVSPETLEIYRLLGMRSLVLAERQGADFKKLKKMRETLNLIDNRQ